jgi:hypothetical protein
MFDENITPAQYKSMSSARANLVRQLLITALQDNVPAGYLLSVDPDRMYGNALLALRPVQPAEGTKMICFIHAINYRSSVNGGEVSYRPTLESVRACGDERGTTLWNSDKSFGADGRVEITSAAEVDIHAMVQFVAAQVCSLAPFTSFEWRRCVHDDGGKWELFDGERRLQSVWKSGSGYGTLMGTCPTTLTAAKGEAEAAARFQICCEHQERLASLGVQIADGDAAIEQEEVQAPSM